MDRNQLLKAIDDAYGIAPEYFEKRSTERIWKGLTDVQKKRVQLYLNRNEK